MNPRLVRTQAHSPVERFTLSWPCDATKVGHTERHFLVHDSLTLGQQLLTWQRLERKPIRVVDSGEETLRRDTLAVQRFFADAKAHIEHAIRAGGLPTPFLLGQGDSRLSGSSVSARAGELLELHAWPAASREVPANSSFRPLWDHFVAWAGAQQLDVWFEHIPNGREEPEGQALHVCPASNLLAKVPAHSPKLSQQFNVEQACRDYLEKEFSRKG